MRRLRNRWGREYMAGTTAADTTSHACNCVGCCDLCSQCVTTPWHAATCDKIAALRDEQARVIEEVQRGHADDGECRCTAQADELYRLNDEIAGAYESPVRGIAADGGMDDSTGAQRNRDTEQRALPTTGSHLGRD